LTDANPASAAGQRDDRPGRQAERRRRLDGVCSSRWSRPSTDPHWSGSAGRSPISALSATGRDHPWAVGRPSVRGI